MIDGFILAGGQSRRMGQSKPTLLLGGKTLLDRAATELSRIADPLFAVGNLTTDVTSLPIIKDALVGANARGAIIGLYTALFHAKTEWAAVLACDLPFVNGELLTRMVSAGAVDLVTNNREIDTSVMVSDGAMLVLGGLISDEVRETIRKVPALGDIPVLGNLFRYRRENGSKRNLMVFLKPSILRDEALESAISSDKYNFIRARQLEKRTKPGYVLPDNSQPLLPEIPWAAPLRLPEPGGGDR